MGVIDCNGGAWERHPQRLPERRGRVDRHDWNGQPLFQRSGKQPVPDALVVPAVHDSQALAGVQVHDGCHPGLEPCPRLTRWVLRVAHGPEPVLINAQHPWAERVYVGQPVQAGFITAARTIHQDTPKPAVVSYTARPEWTTASTSWSRSRLVELARHETWGCGFKEGQPVARRFLAQPLHTLFLPAGGDDPAARATQWLIGFDDDLPATGTDGGRNDTVVGQVEEDGGSVGCHPGTLVQA